MCSGRSRSSHTNPWVKTKAWKTYCLLCAGQGPSTDPVQNRQSKQSMGIMCPFMCSDPGPGTYPKVCSAQNPLAKKQGLENLLCFLCPGQGPCTDPKVCSAQNPFTKKKRMKNLPSFLCTEQGPHTNPKCVLSTNPFRQKNKDRKTYLVSCVLVKVYTLIQMCAQHKTLCPKTQG